VTAAVRHVLPGSIDLVTVFEMRCWARAHLYAAGEFDLHEAVDQLQRDAARDGLVAALGQDRVQEMMASAFAAVRMKPTAWDLGATFEDCRDVLDGVTIAELDALIQQNDPQQFRKWMARLSVTEREAVLDLVVTT
jgi:hypothetical protein